MSLLQDRIGVYEPVVAITAEERWRTSWAREPDLLDRDVVLIHADCDESAERPPA